MTYNTDLFKLLFESRADSVNSADILKNLIDNNKLKAIKPIIEKIKISSFSLYNNLTLDDNTVCIEYQSNNTIILDSKYYNKDNIYGKNAKFMIKDEFYSYDSIISIFSYKSDDDSNYNDYYRAVLNSDSAFKIKSVYFSSDFDNSNIEIIRRIISNNNIKLYKMNSEKDSFFEI